MCLVMRYRCFIVISYIHTYIVYLTIILSMRHDCLRRQAIQEEINNGFLAGCRLGRFNTAPVGMYTWRSCQISSEKQLWMFLLHFFLHYYNSISYQMIIINFYGSFYAFSMKPCLVWFHRGTCWVIGVYFLVFLFIRTPSRRFLRNVL